MKGIIFTEFGEMVEATFGFDTWDAIVEKADLPSGGSYTAVGTYDHGEIVSLVVNLSEETNTPVPDLLQAFGTYLFHRFGKLYPSFLEGEDRALGFLSRVEDHIHVEVRKLYPQAELPRFDTKWLSDNELEMIYHSNKHLEDVAEGLIRGCLEHFGEKGEVTREDAGDSAEEGVRFLVKVTSA